MTSGQAGLGADKKPTSPNDNKGWSYETDERSNSIILVISKGSEIRGSIVCKTGNELVKWTAFVDSLNAQPSE